MSKMLPHDVAELQRYLSKGHIVDGPQCVRYSIHQIKRMPIGTKLDNGKYLFEKISERQWVVSYSDIPSAVVLTLSPASNGMTQMYGFIPDSLTLPPADCGVTLAAEGGRDA